MKRQTLISLLVRDVRLAAGSAIIQASTRLLDIAPLVCRASSAGVALAARVSGEPIDIETECSIETEHHGWKDVN